MNSPQKPTDVIKMLIFPAVYMLSSRIDFKDPDVAQKAQIGFTSVVLLILSIYYFIYTRIQATNKDMRVIWVPPKPQPKLPFGLGPEPEKVKPSDFTKTNYKQHEMSLLKEGVQQLIMSAGISFFIGYQFKIYMSLVVQGLTMPFNLYDAVLFRKYVLGQSKNDDGSNLYNEQFSAPTVESIAVAERLAAARAAGVGSAAAPATEESSSTATPSIAKSAIPKDEPRVVEITEEDEKKPVKKEESSSSSKKEETENQKNETSAHDID